MGVVRVGAYTCVSTGRGYGSMDRGYGITSRRVWWYGKRVWWYGRVVRGEEYGGTGRRIR
eukprot:638029-Rhodomonas_salina.1